MVLSDGRAKGKARTGGRSAPGWERQAGERQDAAADVTAKGSWIGGIRSGTAAAEVGKGYGHQSTNPRMTSVEACEARGVRRAEGVNDL